ncbi:MAG: Uma2 family endonuclease [Leptolyngbyaceae bacterium]|nr:Uma2 family endonuclease [Leptolyngbyaceae bacterium]
MTRLQWVYRTQTRTMLAAVRPHHFTVSEYHRMSEFGILAPSERTELLNGQIITMAAKGTAHSSATTLTKTLFERRLSNQATIRVQDPISLSTDSEPEPDITLAVLDPLAYSTHHPTASEVFLVIEIADSSLKYDLEIKAPTYSKAGILEYWVLDVIKRQLHVFRQPSQEGYQSQMILAETLEVTPLEFPDCAIAIRELLPPLLPLTAT